MCVSCNVPLFIADSVQADRQRALIRSYIDEGLTKDQIKARLVAEYGEDVLAMPEDDGTGLAAKIVPVIAVAALLAALAFLLPRWRRRPPAPVGVTGAAAGPVTDAELERLDEDLKRFG
jgi:cytochrome c-type biogenesis protein CcmH/NrfF